MKWNRPVSDWTLLCPGPSLKLYPLRTFEAAGPVVAINNAVLTDLPVDIWCCQDPPAKFAAVHALFDADKRRSLLVWCRAKQEATWRGLGYRTWGHADSEIQFKSDHVVTPGKLSYSGLTVTVALSRIIGLGAHHVMVYGMDMAGQGYAYGHDNRTRDAKAWNLRWAGERTTVQVALQQWRKMGVVIDCRTAPASVNRA